jgi:tetratricopeptide (TPR) repeat protein
MRATSFSQANFRGPGKVVGFVFGSGRTPVAEAKVELLNEADSVAGRTKTDGSGRFTFETSTRGSFTIRVPAFGTYSESTRRVEAGDVQGTGELEIYLRPLKRNSSSNAVIFAQEIPDEARRNYDQAIADLKTSRTLEGIDSLKKAVAIFPTYYLALNRLGQEYVKIEKFEEARGVFAKAVAVNERSLSSSYGLAYANYATGKYEAAVEAANHALVIDKRSASSLFVLGVSQRRLRKFDDAERSLLQAQSIDQGETPDIYWHLALLYAHNLNRPADAANQLELYLKARPNSTNAAAIQKLITQFRSAAAK